MIAASIRLTSASGKISPIRFKIENDLGNTYMAEDAYRFQSNIGDIDAYLFAEGTHLDMYKKLGAHR